MARPLLLFLALAFLTSTLVLLGSASSHSQHQPKSYYGRRRMLLEIQEDGDQPVVVKKKSSQSTSTKNNTTKLIKPSSSSSSSKNQTKLTKTTGTKLIKLPSDNSSKNKTKPIKSNTTSSSDTKLKPQIKKLNSTSKSSSNSTSKSTSLLTKKPTFSSDPSNSKQNNKTTKTQLQKSVGESKKAPKKPSWIDDDEEDEDLVSEFRDLPSKFQETLMPDLETISKTSRTYLTKYNKEFTKGFKPYVGNKYASIIASFVSFAFIIIPLILVSLIFNRIKAYFSLLKLLIFIQIYLAIYFTILCLSSLITGLEPMKFFYSTSQSTYICVQVLQTLAYVFYLLLLLMYLVLVFSTESGLGSKVLGIGQTIVGFAVGLHYYMTVFHRAVLRQPPKMSWRVQAVYAACFLAVCLFGRLDRRSKKAYLEDGGQEGKKS